MLLAFHFLLMSLRKEKTLFTFFQQWLNSWADWIFSIFKQLFSAKNIINYPKKIKNDLCV